MTDAPLRPTGIMERFNILRNHVGFYHSVGAAATYTVPKLLVQSFGSIENLVNASLAEVISKQPILGVTLEDEGTPEPRWVRLDTIDLRKVTTMIDGDPKACLDGYLKDVYRAPFIPQVDIPLWRVIVVSTDTTNAAGLDTVSFAVGFTCHHGIGDGLSVGAFHLNFLDALSCFDKEIGTPVSDPVIAVPKVPLLPNQEMKASFPLSIWFTIKQVITNLVYSSEDPLEWSGTLVNADSPRPPLTNLRTFFLPHPVVDRLVNLCRSQKTTFTALINVLIARKIALMYPAYSHFISSIPFSLRKFTGHTERDIGVYVSETTPRYSSELNPPRGYISCRSDPTKHAIKDEQLWDSARKVRAFIAESTGSTKNTPVGLLKFVAKDFPKFFLKKLGKKRQSAFEVTNIGVLDGGVLESGAEGRKPTFNRIVFSSGVKTYGPPFIFFLATTKNSDMCITVNWECGVVKDEDAEELAGWVEEELKRLAEW